MTDRSTLEAPIKPIGIGIQPRARAERLMAEYLRGWGLRDPSMVAAACRRWVGNGETEPNPNESLDVLYRSAVAGATTDIDQWLDHLAATVAPNDPDCRRGLLAIELQAVLDKYPEFLLRYDELPEWLAQHLQRAARPIVPPSQPTPMHEQPLVDEHTPFWIRVISGTAGVVSRIFRLGRAKRS
jgi:hypothetical protein